MKPQRKEIAIADLSQLARQWTEKHKGGRLGFVTSVDGGQVVTLMLDPSSGLVEYWEAPLLSNKYKALTASLPQAHWFERAMWDMFGIVPEGHPRLKHHLLHEEYPPDFYPLRKTQLALPAVQEKTRSYEYFEVRGEGVYEIPVGPIHAGCIEPGHFRFNCFGETILNLDMRLGWVHRGVEKRMIEVPWQKARFVAESASSDTACANALAHAVAVESLFGFEPSPLANLLRTLALELERLAVHIGDVGGMATDIGLMGIASALSRLRGKPLALCQRLSGNRFLRAYIMPGGVRKTDLSQMGAMKQAIKDLRKDLKAVFSLLEDNEAAKERFEVARISRSLAHEFGLVGVAARACGIDYDCRKHFAHGVYPQSAPPVVMATEGNIWARTMVRIGEIQTSMTLIEQLLDQATSGKFSEELPEKLPADAVGVGIVEAFRGELIHLAVTDKSGTLSRYAIKDPSVNNWTTVAIAIRNNLIADFPLCNKSLCLSYSGNDL